LSYSPRFSQAEIKEIPGSIVLYFAFTQCCQVKVQSFYCALSGLLGCFGGIYLSQGDALCYYILPLQGRHK